MNKRTQIIIGIVIIIILLIGVAIFVHLSKNIPSVEIPVEIQKPVGEAMKTCLVLDEEYCQKGEPLYDKDGKFVGLGFSLPDKAKIYVPFDGTIDNGGMFDVFENQTHQGIFIEAREGNKIITFAALGAVGATIKPEQPVFPEKPDRLVAEPVEKGEFVARVNKALPYKIILPSGEKDYDVFIGFWEFNSVKEEGGVSKELFKKFFNYINPE